MRREAKGSQPASCGLFLASSIASLLVLAFSPVGASAAAGPRSYDSQITGFEGVEGLAVDESDDLWVADREGELNYPNPQCGEVYEYSTGQERLSTQKGAGQFSCRGVDSVAVNDSTGYVYIADSSAPLGTSTVHAIDVYDPAGSFVTQWTTQGGGTEYVAIDNSGTASNGRVYVVSNSGRLLAFDSSGNPVSFTASASYINGNEISGTPSGNFGTRRFLSVDNNGNIYVSEQSKVDEFTPSGEFVQAFTGTGSPNCFSPWGAAVDPTTGNLLVANRCRSYLEEFDPSGNYIGEITGTGPAEEIPIDGVQGAVVVDSTGYVYLAANGGEVIDVFAPTTVQPAVSYGGPSNPTHSSVTLNATVDPNGGGDVVSCVFEFGPTTGYGETKPCSAATPYAGPIDVSADFSGLTAERKYHYRVVASSETEIRKSPDATFIPKAVYDVQTEAPTEPHAGRVTLNGSYTGDGSDTSYYFEYVDYRDFEPSAADPYLAGVTAPTGPPGADSGSGSGPQHLSAKIEGLEPYIEYHFRVVAKNSLGTTYGPDLTFFSPPPDLPAIDASFGSDINESGATLNAEVNPGLGATVVRFEYGTGSDYGSRTSATESIGSDSTDHLVSVAISGLDPGTTYHFRVVATNFSGTTRGPDRTLTTQGVATTPITMTPPAVVPPAPVEPSAGTPDCGALRLRAHRAQTRAGKLRRRAASARGSHARGMRRRAAKLASKAKRLSRSAKACSRSRRGRQR